MTWQEDYLNLMLFVCMLFSYILTFYLGTKYNERKERWLWMRAVAYLRVSKEEEDMRNQELAIKKYAKERGIVIEKYFGDEDVSGWKVPILKRKGFNELLKYCEDNNIRNIIIFDLTRFGRNWKDVYSTYYFLEEEGYTLHFVLQPYLQREFYTDIFKDVEEPLRTYLAESMFAQTLLQHAMYAELESVMTSMRTRRGIERVRREGKKVGGKRIPEWVRYKIIDLYKEGYSYDQIREMIQYPLKKGGFARPSKEYISKVLHEEGLIE